MHPEIYLSSDDEDLATPPTGRAVTTATSPSVGRLGSGLTSSPASGGETVKAPPGDELTISDVMERDVGTPSTVVQPVEGGRDATSDDIRPSTVFDVGVSTGGTVIDVVDMVEEIEVVEHDGPPVAVAKLVDGGRLACPHECKRVFPRLGRLQKHLEVGDNFNNIIIIYCP